MGQVVECDRWWNEGPARKRTTCGWHWKQLAWGRAGEDCYGERETEEEGGVKGSKTLEMTEGGEEEVRSELGLGGSAVLWRGSVWAKAAVAAPVAVLVAAEEERGRRLVACLVAG
ncbi:uncharacterized protein A4U43_C09F3940 [Asparagus officinalis]|uniref:Uncharacterized protein n=1 Tax=Asparagus officinalis TaxID=4686 RepID=A0A5P1E6Z1_ASPOF|nr:uncharacterized protein A4U43_C09F3940 [Asparagus officinalis]